MNTSESADELVKICIEGVDRILRISGVGAKNIAMMLIAMSKENTQTMGKTRLTNMIKSGKPVSIFTIKAEDLKKFSQEAKRYGILYSALANTKNSKIDGMVDIMVRDEDAVKLNRIAERFNFTDVAIIKEECEKEKQEKTQDSLQESTKSEMEKRIDDIMPISKGEQEKIPSSNPKEAEEESLFAISSNTKLKEKNRIENFNHKEKKSVKSELQEIEHELKSKEEMIEKQEVQVDKQVKNKEKQRGGKRYKEREEKQKGKHYKQPKHLDTVQKSRKSKNRGRSKV